MLGLGARLWRGRLAITAGILLISTVAVITGHHDAWFGDPFYQASLRDDAYMALPAIFAFAAAAIGAFSLPYFLTVNFVFLWLASLNVQTLFAGEFVRVSDHGCRACLDGAVVFAHDLPAYVIAGQLAAIVTGLFVDASAASPALGPRMRIAIIVILVAALLASEIDFKYVAQVPYITARLIQFIPEIAAAILATILVVLLSRRSPGAKKPPRFLRIRLGLAGAVVALVLAANLVSVLR